MFDLIFWPVLGGAAIIAAWAVLVGLRVFTPPEIIALHRSLALRGYRTSGSRVDRLGERWPVLRRLADNANVSRLLHVANRDDGVRTFLGKMLAKGLAAASIGFMLDGATVARGGGWAFPPYLVLVFAGALMLLDYARLKAAADRRREDAELVLAELFQPLAIVTHNKGVAVDTAVRLLSQAFESDAVSSLLQGERYRALVHDPSRFTPDLYRQIAREYRLPSMRSLGDGVYSVIANGQPAGDVYRAISRTAFANRLTDARQSMASAKTKVTIPVAGMLVPLLVLLGVPAVSELTRALGGG